MAKDFAFASRRGRMIGGGMPLAVATLNADFPPGAWTGWVAYCTDGRLRWSNGVSWISAADSAEVAQIATDVAVNVFRAPVEDMTIYVDATEPEVEGESYHTIGAALEYYSRYLPGFRDDATTRLVVMIRSGHVIREQINMRAVNLGLAIIQAEDAVVPVDPTALTKLTDRASRAHAFVSVQGSASPPRVEGVIFELQAGVIPQDADAIGAGLVPADYTPFRVMWAGPCVLSGVGGRCAGVTGALDIGVDTTSGSQSYLFDARLTSTAGIGMRSRGIDLVVRSVIRGTTNSILSTSGNLRLSGQDAGTATGGMIDNGDYAQDFRKDPAADNADGANADIRVTLGSTLEIQAGVRGGYNLPANLLTAEGTVKDPEEADAYVSRTGTETLTNKTLTAPVLNSEATGTGVQATAADATAGRLLKVGASATVLSASPALRCAVGGTADAITLTTGAGLASLPVGLRLRFLAGAANTGAVTIAVDGGAAQTAQTMRATALPAGYIRTDVDTEITWTGTAWLVSREDERGTNANGEFVRLACGALFVGTSIQGSAGGAFVRTWAAAFSATPRIGAVPSSAATLRSVTTGNNNGTSIDVYVLDGASALTTSFASLNAQGPWY